MQVEPSNPDAGQVGDQANGAGQNGGGSEQNVQQRDTPPPPPPAQDDQPAQDQGAADGGAQEAGAEPAAEPHAEPAAPTDGEQETAELVAGEPAAPAEGGAAEGEEGTPVTDPDAVPVAALKGTNPPQLEGRSVAPDYIDVGETDTGDGTADGTTEGGTGDDAPVGIMPLSETSAGVEEPTIDDGEPGTTVDAGPAPAVDPVTLSEFYDSEADGSLGMLDTAVTTSTTRAENAADNMYLRTPKSEGVNDVVDTIEGDALQFKEQVDEFSTSTNETNMHVADMLANGATYEEVKPFMEQSAAATDVALERMSDPAAVDAIWNAVDNEDFTQDQEDKQAQFDQAMAILGIVSGFAGGVFDAANIGLTAYKQSKGANALDTITNFRSIGNATTDTGLGESRKLALAGDVLNGNPSADGTATGSVLTPDTKRTQENFANALAQQALTQQVVEVHGIQTGEIKVKGIDSTMTFAEIQADPAAKAALDAHVDAAYGTGDLTERLQTAGENSENVGASLAMGYVTSEYRQGRTPWYEPQYTTQSTPRGGSRQVESNPEGNKAKQLEAIADGLGYDATMDADVTKSGPKGSIKTTTYSVTLDDGPTGVGFEGTSYDSVSFLDVGKTDDIDVNRAA